MLPLDNLCSLPRTICKFLSGRRSDNTDVLDTVMLVERPRVSTESAAPQFYLASLHTARNHVEDSASQKAPAFVATRCPMSPQHGKCSPKADFENLFSTSPVSSTRIGDAIDMQEELCFDTDEEDLDPQSLAVDLPRGLFFHGPSEPDSLETNRELLRAIRLQGWANGAVHVIGVCGGSQSSPELREVNVDPEKLMVDVRINSYDDPRLLHIIGAQLHAGTISRLYVSSNCPAPLCEITAGEKTGHTCVLLEQAIEEMYDLEKERQNKEMMIYQRQVCSMMMRSQRQRYLGLQTQ